MTTIAQINIKLAILGAPAVGKTSLRRKYMGQGFLLNYSTTLGTDFANKQLEIDGTKVSMQIWDLAGQTSFLSVTQSLLANSHAAILVYDAINKDSFDHIKGWLRILEKGNQNRADRIPYVVLKNKMDLIEEDMSSVEFTEEDYVRYLADYELINQDYVKSIPTSAKTGRNVDLVFNTLAYVILRIVKEEMNEDYHN